MCCEKCNIKSTDLEWKVNHHCPWRTVHAISLYCPAWWIPYTCTSCGCRGAMPWRIAPGLWPLAALSLVCLWDKCQGTACPGWGRCSVFSGLSSQERVGVEHSTSSHYIQDLCLFAKVLHNRAAAKYLFSCSWMVAWFDAYWCSSTQCFMSINRKELCSIVKKSAAQYCSTILIEITVCMIPFETLNIVYSILMQVLSEGRSHYTLSHWWIAVFLSFNVHQNSSKCKILWHSTLVPFLWPRFFALQKS